MAGLKKSEILTVVNRYIGVHGGYLGDFSYRTHREFYPEFCDLDISTAEPGTTRETFIAILERGDPLTQAKILRGVLKKYPTSSTEIRTPERVTEIEEMIRGLESGCGVASSIPSITSELVTRAINDAETLLRTNGATSGVDRMHTAFHGFLKATCDKSGIAYRNNPAITELYKALRTRHPKLLDLGPHGADLDKILRSFAAAVDSLNTLRNHASVAHPNETLLGREEAYLYVNAVRTLMAYLDVKLSAGAG